MFLSQFYRLPGITLTAVKGAVLTAMITTSAQADLLKNPLDFPLISFNSATIGATSYNANTDEFSLNSGVTALLENTSSLPVFISNGEINLAIMLDNSGALIANSATQDVEISGSLTLNNVLYSGTLISGKVTAFGYKDSTSSLDLFDFQLTVTGGALTSFYSANMGINLTSETSDFNGDFHVDFSGKAKGMIGGIELPEEPASLGDLVWQDLNRDGLQDIEEPGIEAVTVNLLSPGEDGVCNSADEEVLDTTQTDIDGFYHFVKLLPGDYCVEFVIPDGYIVSPQTAGNDNALDSDADPLTGQTQIINLEPGENDLTWDMGLYRLAALGDFVWADLNANGTQESDESGIEGVTVNLLDPGTDLECNSGDEFILAHTTTDNQGLYGFTRLIPGDYCVEFIPLPGFIISPQNFGADSTDSDADPATGQTTTISLSAGETDLTWDAGLYQLAALGDYVWHDFDKDGLQTNSETGVSQVQVNLLDCQGNPVLDEMSMPVSMLTNANGLYLFDNLLPGNYLVEFALPSGFVFSPANVGANSALDSDANQFTGRTACIALASGETNLTLDAGIYQPMACDISVSKSCEILVPQDPTPFSCSDAKPLDQLTMIWNGSQNIDVVAHYGKLNDEILTTISNIAPGDEVTISGFDGAGNDVEWELFAAGTTNSLGKSGFHMSCSDNSMNGPEDCGSTQGNNKSDDGGINSWLFEGMAGSNGLALDCTAPESAQIPVNTNCAFETPAGPHCQGKIRFMQLRYLGGDCQIAPNNQEGKAKCLVSGMAGEDVHVRVSDGGSNIYLEQFNVSPGEILTASATNAGRNDFSSTTVIEVLDNSGELIQEAELHTSCSKPLNLSDRYGSVEVIGLDTTEGGNQSLGANVNYGYVITNNSPQSFSGKAVDDALGSIADPLVLAPGEVFTTAIAQFVLPDSTDIFANTVTVSGELTPSGAACEANASASINRTVLLPECKPIAENKLTVEDARIKWKLFNTGKHHLTVERIEATFPGERGIKKIKLDGDIFKEGHEISPAVFATFINDLKNRQIKPDDDKTLEIEFTDSLKETLPGDYAVKVFFAGGCMIELDISQELSAYKCTKPIDQLTMIWTGSQSVEVQAFKGDSNDLSLGIQAVDPGNEISFTGFAGSPNDVYWQIYDSATGNWLGESKFHLSCSDEHMNGPEDCAKLQGDGKGDDASLINLWQLEGIVDAGGTLDCSP